MLNMSRMVPFCCANSWLSLEGSMPGTGMNEPMRYTTRAASRNSRRLRTSPILLRSGIIPPLVPFAMVLSASLVFGSVRLRCDVGDAAAGGENRFACALGHADAAQFELAGQLAGLDQLGLLGVRRHHARVLQHTQIDGGFLQLFKVGQTHFGAELGHGGVEAALRQATLDRHLAALEADLAAAALAGALALVATAGSLAHAGTDAAA